MHIHLHFPNINQQILFNFCIGISNKNVSLGIVNERISKISDRVMALVNIQKNGFLPLFPYYLEFHDETSQDDQSNKSFVLIA